MRWLGCLRFSDGLWAAVPPAALFPNRWSPGPLCCNRNTTSFCGYLERRGAFQTHLSLLVPYSLQNPFNRFWQDKAIGEHLTALGGGTWGLSVAVFAKWGRDFFQLSRDCLLHRGWDVSELLFGVRIWNPEGIWSGDGQSLCIG